MRAILFAQLEEWNIVLPSICFHTWNTQDDGKKCLPRCAAATVRLLFRVSVQSPDPRNTGREKDGAQCLNHAPRDPRVRKTSFVWNAYEEGRFLRRETEELEPPPAFGRKKGREREREKPEKLGVR